MPDIPGEIRRLGGAAKAAELLAAGADRRMISAARRSGLVFRPRKGWYVLPATPPALIAAVRVGGRATCVTALRELGIWVTDQGSQLAHVAVHRSACQLRGARTHTERQSVVGDAFVHWAETPRPRSPLASRLVEVPADAIRDAFGCLDDEGLFAAVESARHQGLLLPGAWATLLAQAPRRIRKVLARAGATSESGLESIFIFRIRRLGLKIRLRQQVVLGRYRVDILIGDRLIVELDGSHHDAHADRVRDAHLVIAGYAVLRFDYTQVISDWVTVERAVLVALIRGDHMR